MIYIDPPYNTGTDFIYKDDRKFTASELSEMANVTEDEAKRILDFTNKDSNSHSAWLTFMYPRLYVARELLKEDGVIFISIDDNEVSQLKLLCDEIFGEENHLSQICLEISKTQGMKVSSAKKGNIVKNHEYILVFAKNKQRFNEEKKVPLLDFNNLFDIHYSKFYRDQILCNLTDHIEKTERWIIREFENTGIKFSLSNFEKMMTVNDKFKKYIFTNSEYIYIKCRLVI